MNQTVNQGHFQQITDLTFESSKCRFMIHPNTNDLYVSLFDLLRLLGAADGAKHVIGSLERVQDGESDGIPTLLSKLSIQRSQNMTGIQRFWFEVLMRGSLLIEDASWIGVVPTRKLYREYLEFCKKIGEKFPVANNIFTKHIKSLTFHGSVKRIRKIFHYVGHHLPTSEWCLRFDDLDACRKAFNEAIGRNIMWRITSSGRKEDL